MMMDNQKGYSIVAIAFIATVTLLSCFNPASGLSVFPRITRSDDAITIDCNPLKNKNHFPLILCCVLHNNLNMLWID